MLDAFAGMPVLMGFLLGLSLAAPLGPVNALITTRAAAHGFWPGASVGVGATTADGILCTLMALGAVHVITAIPGLNVAITLLGAGLMFFFAWGAYRSARAMGGEVPGAGSAPKAGAVGGLAAGFTLAITSPYGLAWWLGVGTQLFQDYGLTIFVGFFGGVLGWVFAFAGAIVWARSRVAGLVRGVTYVSAAVLLAFALVFLWTGGSAVVDAFSP